eukprot:TRINITY_DN16_c0_g1_i1.p1 TRINITY_DN16_c0_g1~~TRINITY_DN16_c0_g1_i1.p1  ORF type:complete len:609 (+),score=198.16 TRINITY_DN16_c0_g1_i1:72-1829(+)
MSHSAEMAKAAAALGLLALVQHKRTSLGGGAGPLSVAAIAAAVVSLRRGQLGPFNSQGHALLRVLSGMGLFAAVVFICRNPIILNLIKLSLPKSMATLNIPKVGHNDTPDDFNGFFNKMLTRVPRDGPFANMGYYTEDAALPFGQITFEWFVVNSAEYGTDLLQKNIEHMLWPGLVEASAAFFGPKVLFILEGDQWRRLRKIMRGELIHQNLHTFADLMGREAYKIAKKMRAEDGVDMYMVAAHYHLDASAGAMFSTSLGAIDSWPTKHKQVEAFVWFTNELPRRAFAFGDPALNTDYKTDNEDNRAMRKAHDNAHSVILEIVKRRLDAGRPTKDPDLLELMMRAYEEDNAGPIDPKKLMDDVGANLVELIFAGFNTVTGVMGNAFYAIATDPEVAAKVRQEVSSVLKGEDRPLTMRDYVQLKYTIRCFHETCRRYSPSPVMARKIWPNDYKIGNVTLPKGTQAMVPLDSLANDPRYWDKPEQFNPGRREWDSASAKDPTSGAKWYGKLRGAYMPFSDGPRNCVGQNVAEMEYVMLIATVFNQWDLKPSAGYKHERHFNGFGFAPRCGNTKERGVRVQVMQRGGR